MKPLTIALFGVGAYFVWQAIEKGQFAGSVQVVLKGVVVENINSIIVQMVVQNITNTTVTFNSMSGSLLMNGDEVANISDFTPRTIQANGETEIDVKIVPSLSSVLMSALTFTGNTINFTATGNINLDGLPILPFTLEKSVTI